MGVMMEVNPPLKPRRSQAPLFGSVATPPYVMDSPAAYVAAAAGTVIVAAAGRLVGPRGPRLAPRAISMRLSPK